jgi:hypothetical protein
MWRVVLVLSAVGLVACAVGASFNPAEVPWWCVWFGPVAIAGLIVSAPKARL